MTNTQCIQENHAPTFVYVGWRLVQDDNFQQSQAVVSERHKAALHRVVHHPCCQPTTEGSKSGMVSPSKVNWSPTIWRWESHNINLSLYNALYSVTATVRLFWTLRSLPVQNVLSFCLQPETRTGLSESNVADLVAATAVSNRFLSQDTWVLRTHSTGFLSLSFKSIF